MLNPEESYWWENYVEFCRDTDQTPTHEGFREWAIDLSEQEPE